MSKNPTVSVVVPTYNRAGLLRRAVKSILDQTFQDLEVIIVDDASTDDISQVVAAFQDPRVRRLRHNHNRGASAARNTGIEAARGEYVAFLDSDDVWKAQKLEKQLALMKKRRQVGAEDVVVYCGDMTVNERGTVVKQFTPQERGHIRERLLCETCASAIIVPRVCLERIGGFDEDLPSAQDRDLYIRLARFCFFDYVPEQLLVIHVGHAGAGRISASNEAAVAGAEALLDKYGTEIRRQGPEVLARHYYYKIGIRSLKGGKQRKARRYLTKAVRLAPSLRNVVGWGMALLGQRAYLWSLCARKFVRRLLRDVSKTMRFR